MWGTFLNRSFILKYIEMIIHVFVYSHLDYCNSLFTSLGQKQLHCLQAVQNSAARLLTHITKSVDIRPVLKLTSDRSVALSLRIIIILEFILHF